MTLKVIQRWLLGFVVGTVFVALTSPAFVRTYSSRTWDPLRQRWVYPDQLPYRWRAEGYATSFIGPHGIVGRADLPDGDSFRVALWGDSQAEGVTLPDHAKLGAVLENARSDLQVIPLAGSGEDLRHWIQGIEAVEEEFQIDEHWILVCELVDFAAIQTQPPLPNPQPPNTNPNAVTTSVQSQWVDYIPDFVIEAGRSLALDSNQQLRRMRFGIGPAREAEIVGETSPVGIVSMKSYRDPFWSNVAKRLSESTARPITVIYAPKLPVIWDSVVVEEDFDAIAYERLVPHLRRHEIDVIDCRPLFRRSASSGEFPHGFHNGRFGWGHLNRVGNELITRSLANRVIVNRAAHDQEHLRSPEN